ncbi:hypothetical protein [Roseovarius nanhaiticus]|uniref:hypothetical protein n=1 Tax=Roseovarius nanhaiticus TaxID=573024 RepID=UPI00249073A0|nr:hypothetical protein [Roseovarius nanhaiticus]
MTDAYKRPSKTKAAALGDRNRQRWARHLRQKLSSLVSANELMLAKETANTDAVHRQREQPRHYPWFDRPQWASVRIRLDQMATVEMLQRRHLEATEKEISRAEVLAALMASGLEAIINHEDFGGKRR